MAQPKVAPYGSWKSPITSDLIVSESVALGQIALDGDDIYWIEQRPSEGGRNVVVRRTPDGKIADVTPKPFNARTRVHEYGGGVFAVSNGTVYFSNYNDQRLYRQDSGAAPKPLTPAVDLRYADGVIDSKRHRMIAVREDHTGKDEAVNAIVSVNLDGDNTGGQILVSGNNFYSNPRLSPDGSHLAWLTWNHPNMPWDGTELWVGELNDRGEVSSPKKVAGGVEESIFQPEWSPDGTLYFVSDRSGWWNLYRLSNGKTKSLHPLESEFGVAQWVFGLSTYAFESAQHLICTFGWEGKARFAILDTASLKLEQVENPFTSITGIRAKAGLAVFTGGSPSEATAVHQYDRQKRKGAVLRRSSGRKVDADYLSMPQAIEYPTENGLTAHAYYYPPRNRDFVPPKKEKPPLIVRSHGGPTSATSTTLQLNIQYWTSRGFAFLDVNYGGSTGHGRAYRERLNGQWGVVDVDDCANGARYLAKQGLADGERVAIMGGSAGGYTTLCAVAFSKVFKAGASHFGISDLEVFVRDTHKFESRYCDRLVGPYPERRDIYRERSAINFVDRISCPLILFQGLEDKIVPPNQAELMVAALRARKMPVAYIAFEGEQHGFRRAPNIKRSLDGELYFYSKVFGFKLADKVEPVRIENLPVSSKQSSVNSRGKVVKPKRRIAGKKREGIKGRKKKK